MRAFPQHAPGRSCVGIGRVQMYCSSRRQGWEGRQGPGGGGKLGIGTGQETAGLARTGQLPGPSRVKAAPAPAPAIDQLTRSTQYVRPSVCLLSVLWRRPASSSSIEDANQLTRLPAYLAWYHLLLLSLRTVLTVDSDGVDGLSNGLGGFALLAEVISPGQVRSRQGKASPSHKSVTLITSLPHRHFTMLNHSLGRHLQSHLAQAPSRPQAQSGPDRVPSALEPNRGKINWDELQLPLFGFGYC